MELNEARERITEIDKQISSLIDERGQLAKAAQLKKAGPLFTADREAYVRGLYKQRDVIDALLTTSKRNNIVPPSADKFRLIAGPCSLSVDQKDLVRKTAEDLLSAGCRDFRAGCWKPRTNPYEWQGDKLDAALYLADLSKELDLNPWTEILDAGHIHLIYSARPKTAEKFTYWIGARNGQNFELIKHVARLCAHYGNAFALKRGPWMTVEEWLCAAEYARKAGCEKVILIERGISGRDPMFRNTLDLVGAMAAKAMSDYEVIVDLSHSTGIASFALPLIDVIKAAGLDGVMIESFCQTKESKTDAYQAVASDELSEFWKDYLA